MRIVFISLVLLTALSATAADYTAGTKCPTVVHHKPMKNLEYEAGKTASGYAVAPAEETPPVLTADDFRKVKIPLNIPVSEHLDEDKINLNTEQMELRVGEVEVGTKTGGITFDSKDISSAEPTLVNPDCWDH